jgi:uncharacterized protein YciI
MSVIHAESRRQKKHGGALTHSPLLEFQCMPRQHYFFKLIPPRPTFPHDITENEAWLMHQHSRYFDEQFAAGKLLIYGPVMAASGAFGLAVLEVESEAEARQFGEADPSVRAGLNRFEVSPMRVSGARGKQA